jgi:hypothetical protein
MMNGGVKEWRNGGEMPNEGVKEWRSEAQDMAVPLMHSSILSLIISLPLVHSSTHPFLH